VSEQPENPERATIGPAETEPEGVGDALRAAVERTLAVTADSAEGTRRRAQDLLDDVVRRGQVAREEVTRRGEEATSRLAGAVGAVGELRRPDADGVEDLAERLAGAERRIAALEAAMWGRTNPEPEPETSLDKPHEQEESGG
jgi:polyhydroxyalkanoate synthesis regulator phasin